MLAQKYKQQKQVFFSQVCLFGRSQQSEHKWILLPAEKLEEHIDKDCNMINVDDDRSSNKNLSSAGYLHSVVIQKTSFVNNQADHTNSINSICSQLKSWMSSLHEVDKSIFEEIPSVFRFNYCVSVGCHVDCFEQFLQELRIDFQGQLCTYIFLN